MSNKSVLPPLSSSTHSKNNSPSLSPHSESNHTVFRTAYSLKSRSQIYFAPQGRTKQSFKDECDINRIMARFAKTGVFEHLSQRAPTFGDVADIDFQGCMDVVAEARERFAMLPSDLRDRFANDPARLLAFVQDPKNLIEARSLGLLRASETPTTGVEATIATPPGTGVASPPAAAPAASTTPNPA